MEFKQISETGSFKQIGNDTTSIRIKDVADKCKLVKTDNGVKIECNYTGPGAGSYLQFIKNHNEELTNFLMNPDTGDFFEWCEVSHQTPMSLKKHEKEKLIIYVNFDPESKFLDTGISDDNITMKLGAPLLHVNINSLTRKEFKLKIYDMLLLADEIAVGMNNLELRQMANIEMVKTYLTEIFDKYHDNSKI